MAFHLSGDSKYPIGMGGLTDCTKRSRGAGHERSSRRADSTAQRDCIVDLDLEGAITHSLARCGHDSVGLPVLGPFGADVVDDPSVGLPGAHHAPGDQGEGDAVECRAEVGRRGGCGSGGPVFHGPTLSSVTVPPVGDIFDFESLLPEMILALGLALLIGNGLAWWKHRKGETPKGIEEASYRPARVVFLSVVGVLLTTWGAVTLLT